MIYAEKLIIFIHARAFYKIIEKKFFKRRAEISILAGYRIYQQWKTRKFTLMNVEKVYLFHARHAFAVGTSIMSLKMAADANFVLPYACSLYMDKKLMFHRMLKFHYKMRFMIR